MGQDAFFKRRTVTEISALDCTDIDEQEGLVGRISKSASSLTKGLKVRAKIIPKDFYWLDSRGSSANNVCWEYGDLLFVEQPHSVADSLSFPFEPWESNLNAYDALSEKYQRGELREEELNHIGIARRGVGRDTRIRFYPHISSLKGAQLAAYLHNRFGGIEINWPPKNRSNLPTSIPLVATIPSRRRGYPDYERRLENVPIIRSPSNLADILNLEPKGTYDRLSGEPNPKPSNEQYRQLAQGRKGLRKRGEYVLFTPQDWVSMYFFARQTFKTFPTVMRMNPFITPPDSAIDFFKFMNNNMLILDEGLAKNRNTKERFRHLNEMEMSILYNRFIVIEGYRNTAWHKFEEDTPLIKADWSIPGKD